MNTPTFGFDPAAFVAWLHLPEDVGPPTMTGDNDAVTRLEWLGIDADRFRRPDDVLLAVHDILHADPDGLTVPDDVCCLTCWLVNDDIFKEGMILVVELANGINLASVHLCATDITDPDLYGIDLAVSALTHVAAEANHVVDGYRWAVARPSIHI